MHHIMRTNKHANRSRDIASPQNKNKKTTEVNEPDEGYDKLYIGHGQPRLRERFAYIWSAG